MLDSISCCWIFSPWTSSEKHIVQKLVVSQGMHRDYPHTAEQIVVDLPFNCSSSFGLLRPVYIFRKISATLPSGVKYNLRPIFGLVLLLLCSKFSAISCRGSFRLILPSSLCSNVCLYYS